jgi:hypothetical protein
MVKLVRDTHLFWGLDSIVIGIAGFALVLVFATSKKVPSALLLFIAGLGLALASNPETFSQIRLGWNLPHWVPLTWPDFRDSFFRAALPQIPLTTLNSVISSLQWTCFANPARPRKVTCWARNLYPDGFTR